MKTIIAEKPSVAREIARIVGATKREEGYFEGGGYAVTWAFGHLVQLAMPDGYGVRGFVLLLFFPLFHVLLFLRFLFLCLLCCHLFLHLLLIVGGVHLVRGEQLLVRFGVFQQLLHHL
jgi:hypothetical protein